MTGGTPPRQPPRAAHISVFTLGTRGDTQPYVALGQGLARRCHRVRMVASGPYEGLPRETGLPYTLIDFDAQSLFVTPEGRRWQGSGHSTVAFARRAGRTVAPLRDRLLDQITAAMRGTDAVVFSPFAFPPSAWPSGKGCRRYWPRSRPSNPLAASSPSGHPVRSARRATCSATCS